MDRPIILDTGHSIDDLFAVALAACSPELRLVGVLTAFDKHGTRARTTRMLLNAYGRGNVAVAHGSRRNPKEHFFSSFLNSRGDGLSLPDPPDEDAITFLYRRLVEYRSVTLVVTGPLTNVAELLHLHPEAAGYIDHIYFTGGWITQALPEHNVRLDPEAAAYVLEQGIPFTALGYEATRGYRLLRPHRARLESATAPGPRLLHAIYQAWCEEDGVTAPGMLDPMAITFMCGVAPAHIEPVHVAIETKGPGRGTMYRADKGGSLIDVATKIEGSRYIDFMISRVAPRLTTSDDINPSHWHVDLRAAYQLNHYPGWSLTSLENTGHTLALIQSGTCDVTIGSDAHQLQAGSALYLAPGASLSVRSSQGMEAFWFYFEAATRSGGVLEPLNQLPWPVHFPALPDPARWYAMARRVEQHWVHPWPESTLLCQAAFLEMLANLCARAEEQLNSPGDVASEAALQAKRWIEARVSEPINLDDIARSVSMSKYHLLRVFRDAFGMPPLQYHRQLRLDHARRLLRLQHLTVREVAARVGYDSTTAFTRAFKREYGLTPSDEQGRLG